MADYQVPRLAFAWLLFAQALLLLPHLFKFPVILVPVWLVCTVWRVMVYRQRWTYPSSMVKTLLVIASFVVLSVVQRRWLTVETAILTLLIAFLLKLLEMKQRRDVLVCIYLGYFVIVAELLLSQSIVAGIYLVAALLAVTATLVALQSANDETSWLSPFLQSAKMLALSLPIMLVAFLVFPRLEPLWTVPMPAGSGKTGVSGTMTPGAFSQLAQSDALAFRVKFAGNVPPLPELYWRGITLTRFDGKTWFPIEENVSAAPLLQDMMDDGKTPQLHYRVTMEPSYQEWIFPLAGVTETSARVFYLRDFTLKSEDIIDQRQSWDFSSYRYAVFDKEILAYHQRKALELPEGFNPQTIEFAQDLRAKTASPEEYSRKVLEYFRNENFFYTLSPPLLGKHSVDDFLFRSRQGFCEHYAGAFVVLMRAAGIPARVVAGYQGGDINPYEKHVTVRQFDAHAWVEVWFDGRGWVRMDPTYAVAPERIESGGQESLQNDEQFLAQAPFSPMRFRNISWLRQIEYRYDQVNFLWHSRVLDYSGSRQQSVLLAMLGNTSPRTIALFFGGVFMFFGLGLGAYFSWRYRRRPLSPAERIYRRLLRKMARKGLQKQPAEGAMDFAVKARAKWPQAAGEIDQVTEKYLLLMYAQLPDKAGASRLLKQFRRDVIRLRL